MASVDVVNVRKSYGATEVLHGVSVSIADGEFVILVGPSGCGKSTLLRMIAGLEFCRRRQHQNWRARREQPGAERPGHRHGVPELRALSAQDRRGEHELLPQAQTHSTRRRSRRGCARAAEILDVLPPICRVTPRQLSGGQRQRVAMGRAIVRDPQVFLFDEPLSNLDAKLRVQMRSRNQGAAPAAEDDDDLCDARSGRGA